MKKTEILDLVKEFYKQVISKKPPLERMREEAKFMGFKLRPVQGDIFKFATIKSKKLIEIVWFIGKLDEFLHKKSRKKITEKEIDEVLEAVNEIYGKELLKGLSSNDLKNFGLELELIKHGPLEKNFN